MKILPIELVLVLLGYVGCFAFVFFDNKFLSTIGLIVAFQGWSLFIVKAIEGHMK